MRSFFFINKKYRNQVRLNPASLVFHSLGFNFYNDPIKENTATPA